MMNGPENLKDSSMKSPLSYMLEMMGMNNNPQIQMITEMMQKQDVFQQEASKDEDERKSKKRRLLGKIEKVFEENKRLRHENSILQDRIEILAYALGACPECWGDDRQCETCRGQGKPGAYIPEKDSFDQYVLPAVRTLRMQRTKTDSPIAAHSGNQAKPGNEKVDTRAK